MKFFRLAVLVLVLSGCADTGALQDQMQKMSNELRELAVAQQSMNSEVKRKFEELGSDMDAMRATHEKDNKEINTTLLEIQKDFYQNKRITEDSARRVYLLETLVAATRTQTEEKAEGEVLHVKSNQIITSMGTKYGIKAGDVLAVFRDSLSKDKIATARVTVAELTQSTGEIIEKSETVSRGNIVKPLN